MRKIFFFETNIQRCINNSCYAPVIPAEAGIRVFRRFLLSQE